jgi:hypothetical protein
MDAAETGLILVLGPAAALALIAIAAWWVRHRRDR